MQSPDTACECQFHRLAVDGHHLSGQQASHRLAPVHKAFLEAVRVQPGEHIAKSVVGRDAVGEIQEGAEPDGIELYNQAKSHFYSIIRRDRPDFQERIDIRDFFRVLVVEPQQMFERIRAQSGAFLVSAFHERFERTEILRHDSHTPIYAHHVLRVPHAAKESILNDLRVVNVSNEYLFPCVDQTAKAITEQYRSRST